MIRIESAFLSGDVVEKRIFSPLHFAEFTFISSKSVYIFKINHLYFIS